MRKRRYWGKIFVACATLLFLLTMSSTNVLAFNTTAIDAQTEAAGFMDHGTSSDLGGILCGTMQFEYNRESSPGVVNAIEFLSVVQIYDDSISTTTPCIRYNVVGSSPDLHDCGVFENHGVDVYGCALIRLPETHTAEDDKHEFAFNLVTASATTCGFNASVLSKWDNGCFYASPYSRIDFYNWTKANKDTAEISYSDGFGCTNKMAHGITHPFSWSLPAGYRCVSAQFATTGSVTSDYAEFAGITSGSYTQNSDLRTSFSSSGNVLVYSNSENMGVIHRGGDSAASGVLTIHLAPIEKYKVTPSVTNGTIKVDNSSAANRSTTEKEVGQTTTVTFTANPGYVLDTYSGLSIHTDSVVGASSRSTEVTVTYNTSTVDGDEYKPMVTFKPDSCNITTKVTNGTIALDSNTKTSGAVTSVQYDTTHESTYAPLSGYHLKSVKVNGSGVSLGTYHSAYTFTNIQSDAEIAVDYARVTDVMNLRKSVQNSSGQDIDKCIVGQDKELTYTISFTNGTGINRAYTITDAIPAHTTLVEGSISDGGTASEGTISWNMTNVAVGTHTVSFKVKVNEDSESATISNEATVVEKKISGSSEADESGVTNRVTNWVVADNDEHLWKHIVDVSRADVNGHVVKVGDVYEYQIKVTNPASIAKTFTITDDFSNGFKVLSVSDSGAIADKMVTWDVEVPANSSKIVTASVTVIEENQDKIIENKAAVTVNDTEQNRRETDTTKNPVLAQPKKDVFDATTNVTSSIDEKVINDKSYVLYTIDWSNPDSAERDLVIEDTLSQYLSIKEDVAEEEIVYRSGMDEIISNGGTYQADTNKVTWNIHAAAGEKGTVSFYAYVKEGAQNHSFTNNAWVTLKASEPTEEDVRVLSNQVKNYVFATPTKEVYRERGQLVSDKYVKEGEILYYEITFSNPAGYPKTFTINDTIPEKTHVATKGEVSDVYGGESGSSDLYISDEGNYSYDTDRREITWTMPLPAGESKTVFFYVIVDDDAKGSVVVNRATVGVDLANKYTVSSTGDTTVIYILDDPTKVVLNEKGDDIDYVVKQAGDIVTYWVTFGNVANKELAATVTDKLSEDVEYVDGSAQFFDCYNKDDGAVYNVTGTENVSFDKDNNTVTFSAPCAAKCQRTVGFKVRILDSAQGKIIKNTAEVYYDDATRKSNEVRTPVIKDPVKMVFDGSAKVSSSISSNSISGTDLSDMPVSEGDEITYVITWKNPSDTEKSADIVDKLPEGVTFIEADNGGTFDKETGIVTWKSIKAAAFGRRYVSVKVSVDKTDTDTTLENTAIIYMDEASVTTKKKTPDSSVDEPEPGSGPVRNYVATKRVYSYKEGSISENTVSANSIDDTFVAVGDTIIYEIKVKNTAPNEQQYVITDAIDKALKDIRVSHGGKVVDGKATWSFSLASGDEIKVSIVAEVTDGKSTVSGNSITKKQTTKDTKKKIVNKADIAVTDTVTQVKKTVTTNEVVNYIYSDFVKSVVNEKGSNVSENVLQSGDKITYTLSFVNTADKEKDFVISDKLSEGVTFEGASNGGTYDEATRTVSWKLTKIAAGVTTKLSIYVKVNDTKKGQAVHNIANLSNGPSSISSNEIDTYTLKEPVKTVHYGEADINGKQATAGQEITFAIVYNNPTGKTQSVTITDKLDSAITGAVTTISDGGTLKDGTITWTFSKVPPHTDGKVSFKVKVPDLEADKEIMNKASVTIKDAVGIKTADSNTVKVTLKKKPVPTKSIPVTGDEPWELKKIFKKKPSTEEPEMNENTNESTVIKQTTVEHTTVVQGEKTIPVTGDSFSLGKLLVMDFD